MDLQAVLKALRDYDARKRQLEVERFVQSDTFRGQFGNELIVRLEDARSLEDLMAKLNRVDKTTAAFEKLFAGSPVDDSICREYLGCSGEELQAAILSQDPVRKTVPEKLVLMTFDDATIDHYTTVAPIFEKYGGKANFFACEMVEKMGGGPGFEDKTSFMTWEQIRELHDRGHEIVNHSWKHEMGYYEGSDDYLREQVTVIDDRCRENGIRRPIAFGYPGGRCGKRHESILHELGYHWARGDMKEGTPIREGQSFYDPYMDSPLAMPSFNGAPGFGPARMLEVLNYAKNNRVVILAYHQAEGPEFGPMTLEDQVRFIYEHGGRCITFTELEEYIDPVKAYAYTH